MSNLNINVRSIDRNRYRYTNDIRKLKEILEIERAIEQDVNIDSSLGVDVTSDPVRDILGALKRF